LGAPHNSEAVCGINSAKQEGKKGGGWGEGIFARLLPFPFRLRKEKAEGGFCSKYIRTLSKKHRHFLLSKEWRIV